MPTPPLQISNSVPGYMAKLFVAASSPVTSPVTAATEVGTTATIVSILAPLVGASVTLAGMTPAGYNGTFTVVTTSAANFTVTAAAGLGAATVFGTATSGAAINFGELDEVDINETRDMLDATSHDAAGAKIKKPGLLDWTGTAKGLHLGKDVTQMAMRAALRSALPLFITIYPEGVGTGLTQQDGACYIKDFKFTAAVKDLAKCEFSLEGSGFLVETVQA